VLAGGGGRLGIDLHAADRVADKGRTVRGVLVVVGRGILLVRFRVPISTTGVVLKAAAAMAAGLGLRRAVVTARTGRRSRLSSSALTATMTLEPDIVMAAISGLRTRSTWREAN